MDAVGLDDAVVVVVEKARTQRGRRSYFEHSIGHWVFRQSLHGAQFGAIQPRPNLERWAVERKESSMVMNRHQQWAQPILLINHKIFGLV